MMVLLKPAAREGHRAVGIGSAAAPQCARRGSEYAMANFVSREVCNTLLAIRFFPAQFVITLI
jgi:hypothetical protein